MPDSRLFSLGVHKFSVFMVLVSASASVLIQIYSGFSVLEAFSSGFRFLIFSNTPVEWGLRDQDMGFNIQY